MSDYTKHINNVQNLAEYLLKTEAPSEIIRNLNEIIIYCTQKEIETVSFSEQIKELRTKIVQKWVI